MHDMIRVDLSSHVVSREPLHPKWKNWMGGRGLAVWLFWREVDTSARPLSKENKVIFTPGALNHSKVPFAGRHNVTTLSPLTNTIFSSNCGAPWGADLMTRCRALMLQGESPKPIYVVVDEAPRVESARDLWGLDIFETTHRLMEKEDVKERSVAAIGPPAEQGCTFANIMVEMERTFGRGGMGTVLGSKKVKAIVVKKGSVEDTGVMEKLREYVQTVHKTPSLLRTQGTAGILLTANKNEALPARYYRQSVFKGAEKISGEVLLKHKVGKDTCWSCMVACKVVTRSEKYGLETDGPEFETITTTGSNCGIDDFDSIIKSNHICKQYGLDTISAGNAVAALMEASELGKVDYNIHFGDAEKIHEVLLMIAKNQGIGKMLQKGVKHFAESVGIEAIHMKGMDFPAHDGRGIHGQALAFMTSNRGADHLYSTVYRAEYNTPDRKEIRGKATKVIEHENRNAVLDSLGICKFSAPFYSKEQFVEMLGIALGRPSSWKELQEIGARIVALERKFNNARGFARKDDRLPPRVDVPNSQEALSEYYALRGWSQDGIAP